MKQQQAGIKKILVIGPSWVGDMIMAQSLFILLKQLASAHIQIDVMAPTWSAAILERMPEVSNIIDMPLGHGQLQLKARYQLGKSLVPSQYDQSILLPNSLKSALVPFWASIPKRTGFVGEMRYGLLNDIRKLDKSRLTMTVQRFAALAYNKSEMDNKENFLLKNIPIPALKVSPEKVSLALDKFQLNTDKPILSLCPGAEYGPAKQWPARHYAALAKEKINEGWQVWIFGSEKDRTIGESIAQQLSDSSLKVQMTNLCGDTALAEAIDLMSISQAVVSNDSGLMHMAAALGVNVVGIYGSSDPKFTPPLGKQCRMVNLNMDCSPCFKRTCPLGHTDCLEKLSPELVLQAMESFS